MQNLWIIVCFFFFFKWRDSKYQSCDFFVLQVIVLEHLESCAET